MTNSKFPILNELFVCTNHIHICLYCRAEIPKGRPLLGHHGKEHPICSDSCNILYSMLSYEERIAHINRAYHEFTRANPKTSEHSCR